MHEVLNAPGTRLDASARAFFEPRFRRDFADVRNPRRCASRTVGAGSGRARLHHGPPCRWSNYSSHRRGTPEGRRLLAHELAHVVQTNSGSAQTIHRQADTDPALVNPTTPETAQTDPAQLPPGEAEPLSPGPGSPAASRIPRCPIGHGRDGWAAGRLLGRQVARSQHTS